MSRLHSEHAALSYVLDAGVGLATHVAHSVRPPQPVAAPIDALVTHYGESYNGQTLGCGNGVYDSTNPTIVAISPALEAEMPCGTLLQVCGDAGCILAERQDSCPGCVADVFDLSEAAFAGVCGPPPGVCAATVEVMQTCASMDLAWRERPQRERTVLDDLVEGPLLWLPGDLSTPTQNDSEEPVSVETACIEASPDPR